MSETTETGKSATELLNNAKPFLMFMKGMGYVQERIEFEAGVDARVEKALRVEALAQERTKLAEAEAAAMLRDATVKAEKITTDATAATKREMDAGAVVAADNARMRGENAELRAEHLALVDKVKRLTASVAALETIG